MCPLLALTFFRLGLVISRDINSGRVSSRHSSTTLPRCFSI
jgi:hypothetical protein